MGTTDLDQQNVRTIVFDSSTLSRGSEFVHEGARFVCHVRTTSVPTVYKVLGNFYTGLWAMRDAAEYLTGDLSNAFDTGKLRHDRDGDIGADIAKAEIHLANSRRHLLRASQEFEAAQQAIASIGHKE